MEKRTVHWILPAELVDRLKALAEREQRFTVQQAIVLLEQGITVAEGKYRALDRQREPVNVS